MHLNIAICDDNMADCQNLHHFIHTYAINHKLSAQITTFFNGEEFLTVQKTHPFDIVFMDIFLGDNKGTEIIAACHSDSMQTVFTTTSREYAVEAFQLNASHYLVKPIDYEMIADAMNRCLSARGIKHIAFLEVKTNQGMVSIPMHHIIYIEVFNKVCMIHTEKTTLQTYSSLDSIFELLNNSIFMRAQRSFIVNMNYIKSFYFDHIILSNEKEIILSRKTRAELKNQYQRFLFYLARGQVD